MYTPEELGEQHILTYIRDHGGSMELKDLRLAMRTMHSTQVDDRLIQDAVDHLTDTNQAAVLGNMISIQE